MAVKTEDFLSDEFFKQFKGGEQLNKFLSSIQKRAIEKMLEGELDDHLGYGGSTRKDERITAAMVTGKRTSRPVTGK